MNDAIAAAAKKGFRVWSLSQGYDGLWRCILYNPVKGVEKPFTGTGIGSTPENAVTAALTSETRESLWDDEMMRYRIPPAQIGDALKAATVARERMTKALLS